MAGAALTAVGAVTKNTKLTKIGGFMGLAGGIGNALGLGASAANTAGNAAGQAAEAGGALSNAAEAGGAGASSLSGAAGASTPALASSGLELGSQVEAPFGLANNAISNPAGIGLQTETPLFNTALKMNDPSVVAPSTYDFSRAPSALEQRAAGLTWDDVTGAVGKVGQFARDNKELVNMGGSMLNSMYGPEAEKMQLLKDRDAFDQSIYRRRVANMNAPVKLSYGGA